DRRQDQVRLAEPVHLQSGSEQVLKESVEQPISRREEHLKQDRDEHLPHEVGRENRQAEEALELVVLGVKQQGQPQTQRELDADRAYGEERGGPDGMKKIAVGQHPFEVRPSHERAAGRTLCLVKREDRRVNQRIQEEDRGGEEVW